MSRQDKNIVSEPFVEWDLATAADRVERGLPTRLLADIQNRLRVTNDDLATALQIAPRTLARRRVQQRLTADESERAYRLRRLIEIAVHVLGNAQDARNWMKEENLALGDRSPLEVARTEPGSRLVEHLLGQIAHGLPA